MVHYLISRLQFRSLWQPPNAFASPREGERNPRTHLHLLNPGERRWTYLIITPERICISSTQVNAGERIWARETPGERIRLQASYHPPISSTSIKHVWPGMSFNASTFEFETLLGSILLVASDSHYLLLDWGFCEFKKISRLMKSFGYVVSHGAETSWVDLHT